MKFWITAAWMLIPFGVQAQGFLPGTSSGTVTGSSDGIMIGQRVPSTLAVESGPGQVQTVVSLKSSLELLALVVLDPECPMTAASWKELRRLHKGYREWRTVFVALTPREPGTLAATLAAEKIPWREVSGRKAIATLGVTKAPTLLIIDEWGMLRFRGPPEKAEEAIKQVISHIEPVAEPDLLVPGDCVLPQ